MVGVIFKRVFYLFLYAVVFVVSLPIYASLSVWKKEERLIIDNYLKMFKEYDQGHFSSPLYQNCVREIEQSISRCNYINEKIELPTLTSYPIHFAAIAGDISHLSFLIDHGADLTLTDSKGRTALYAALNQGQQQIKRKDYVSIDRYIQVAKKILAKQPIVV